MAVSDEAKRMNPEAKALWVTALRSGKYEQGRTALKPRTGGYCVLGVLCDVSGKGEWQEELFKVEGVPPTTYRNLYVVKDGKDPKKEYVSNAYPPDEVLLWAGLDGITMHKLSTMNDGWENDETHKPHSFEELAKWIEENL